MEFSQVTLVICLTLVIVVGVNAALYASLRRGTGAGQIELFRRAAHRVRHPWKYEDEALQELSRQVARLKGSGTESGEQENQAGREGK